MDTIRATMGFLEWAGATLGWYEASRDSPCIDSLPLIVSMDAWYKRHYASLLHAAVCALRLQRLPSNCTKKVAVVYLTTPSVQSPHDFSVAWIREVKLEDLRTRFKVCDALVPFLNE